MRPKALATLLVVACVAIGGCGYFTLDEEAFRGTVRQGPEPVESRDERVAYTVELAGPEFHGSSIVSVNVATDEIVCADGRAADPGDVSPGTEVTFVGLVSGEVDSMAPPPMRAHSFQVAC